MLRNYIKVAFRTLNKNRVYAFINILGLALGLTITILVFLFIKDETSYDKHWDGHDRLYRTNILANVMGQHMDEATSPSPMAQTLRNEFTEVETATRIRSRSQEIMVSHNETKIYIKDEVLADSLFFTVFNYSFLHGNPKDALNEPNAIVLNEETALKLFGDTNAMDKIIRYDDRRDLIVKGIVKAPIGHTHLDFNMFIASNNVQNSWVSNNSYHTYFKLRTGVNPQEFEAVMNEKFMGKIKPEIEHFLKITIDEFIAQDNSYEYRIQPVKDIHLYSHKGHEISQNGNIMYIYVFIGIALLVILIAGINFMNLSTARSGKRAKEVGVRKVSGASRKMLIGQFLTESIIQSLLALFIALILVELFIPGFNNTMETEINLFNEHLDQTLIFSLVITLIYGLFAGSYPAFFLSSFQPVSVLKGDFTKTKGGALLRKGLVIFQFTASAILIVGMIIIFNQISFLQNKDIGFTGEQVIVVPLQTDKMTADFRNHKSIFLKNSNVLSVTRASGFPSDGVNNSVFLMEGSQEQFSFLFTQVDYDFFKTLDIELIQGRLFDREKESDSISYFILNETAVKTYNIEDPLNKRIGEFINSQGDLKYGNVIGVVKDFHLQGFNQPIKPMLMRVENNVWHAAFKISSSEMQSTISYLEKEWNKLEPSHPFTYQFLDEKFGALLKQQENFGTMFLFLTILAIIISSMGLYGLSSFTAEQRTKEIGIRKVLGSSVGGIMNMLTKDFLKLVLIANVLSWPIIYLLAKNWLNNFSYQIEMPILPYVFATLLSMIIALITVSSQAYIAANSDPVNALKYE
ncbi:ABC transporter permease [Urechidicola vernalis]|uniref:FtsX-like permease family protein n=1 Tax=Urechidicola vernalis TaxID=3075600 RepID=A0ABU2Y793_9FLAO|nr:FtsX-like permease family protein [Urechidicola sp. P050]MDT0554078.1 FtsX-like permease family protein [Urechidicola sp. P050]